MHNLFVQFANYWTKLANPQFQPIHIWAQCTNKHVLGGQIVNTQQPKELAFGPK
jgi:hypothetical protein